MTKFFYGRSTPQFVSPAGDPLGLLVTVVPSASGIIVGLMVRDGSEAICGLWNSRSDGAGPSESKPDQASFDFCQHLLESMAVGGLCSKSSLREVSAPMVRERPSGLSAVKRENLPRLVAMPFASDIRSANPYRLAAMDRPEQTIAWRRRLP